MDSHQQIVFLAGVLGWKEKQIGDKRVWETEPGSWREQTWNPIHNREHLWMIEERVAMVPETAQAYFEEMCVAVALGGYDFEFQLDVETKAKCIIKALMKYPILPVQK